MAALLVLAGCGANDTGADAQAPADAAPDPVEGDALLVRGRIAADRIEIEPALLMRTRAALPLGTDGRHRVRGLDGEGSVVFDLSFDGVPVADGDEEDHFAFAVPLTRADADRLEAIELRAGDGRSVVRRSSLGPAQLADHLGSPDAPTAARLADGRVRVTWDAGTLPMIAVLDSATGQVLAFGRAGEIVVTTDRDRLDIVVSDGVRSGRTTVEVRDAGSP